MQKVRSKKGVLLIAVLVLMLVWVLAIVGYTIFLKDSDTSTVDPSSDSSDVNVEQEAEDSQPSIVYQNMRLMLYFNNAALYPQVLLDVEIPQDSIIDYGEGDRPLDVSIILLEETELSISIVHVAVPNSYASVEQLTDSIYRVTNSEGQTFYTDDVTFDGVCNRGNVIEISTPCGLGILDQLHVSCEEDQVELCDEVVKKMNVTSYDTYSLNQPSVPGVYDYDALDIALPDYYRVDVNKDMTALEVNSDTFVAELSLDSEGHGISYYVLPDLEELATNFTEEELYRIQSEPGSDLYYYSSLYQLKAEDTCNGPNGDGAVACSSSTTTVDVIDNFVIFKLNCTELLEGGIEECDKFISQELFIF